MNKSLMTDAYELTMIMSALKSGQADTQCSFNVFSRNLGKGRRYGVLAGVGRVLEEIEKFKFTDEQIKWLKKTKLLDSKTLKYLESFQFTGDVYGLLEGETYFENTPVLEVRGTFAECTILETLILSILNYDSAVAAAGARIVVAKNYGDKNRVIFDMGARRTNECAAVEAARVAKIVGFDGTSNLEGAKRYGLKPIGTVAHAYIMLEESEIKAFESQVNAMGASTTLLVDTFDLKTGIYNAIKAGGKKLGAIRIDSEPLRENAYMARKILDDAGLYDTKIILTSDLRENKIIELKDAPVDGFGVGTYFAVGSGVPTANFVYKLVLKRDHEKYSFIEKKSNFKKTVAGNKLVFRQQKRDKDIGEIVFTGRFEMDLLEKEKDIAMKKLLSEELGARSLTNLLMEGGKAIKEFVGETGVNSAVQVHKNAIEMLPTEAVDIVDGKPYIVPEFKML